MTAAIQRRLSGLEARAAHIDPEPIVIIITFVSPGHLDDEPRHARIGTAELLRSTDEAVDDFRDRAKAEALRQRVGRGPVPLVLLNSCSTPTPGAAPKSSASPGGKPHVPPCGE